MDTSLKIPDNVLTAWDLDQWIGEEGYDYKTLVVTVDHWTVTALGKNVMFELRKLGVDDFTKISIREAEEPK